MIVRYLLIMKLCYLIMRIKALFLLSLLMISSASALQYKVDNLNIIAYPNESLKYLLTITNNESSSQQVYINKLFIDNAFSSTQVSIKPEISQLIMAGESKSFNITIPVTEEMALGYYKTIYSTTLLVSYGNLINGVTNTDRVKLDAVVLSNNVKNNGVQNISIITPVSVKPVSDFNITITVLTNVESLKPVIELIISKDGRIVYESNSISELTYGINIIDKTIKLPDKTMAGNYSLLVNLIVGNNTFQGLSDLIIAPYKRVIYKSVKDENLFGKKLVKQVVNDGTEAINVSLNYSSNLLESTMISRSLILIKEGDVTVNSIKPLMNDDYLFNNLVSLEPNQSAELIIEVNYWLLLLTPFLVIIGFISWFFITKRVVLTKEIIQIKKDGDELIIKVGISAKNVSIRSIHNTRIIEDLPLYANKAGGFGSIKGEVNKEKGIITFNIGRLDPKEEVLITYKFKTDIELMGRVNLPPATIKFRTKNGELRESKSNTPAIELVK